MADFKSICQKFNLATLQQLYKKATDKGGNTFDKDVFPISLLQSTFDAVTGERLDHILSRFNYINLVWKSSIEKTRLSVPIKYRRPGLIISYTDYEDKTYIEQYIGKSIADDKWSNYENWKMPFTEGNSIGSITNEQIKQVITEVISSKDLDDKIDESIDSIIKGYINPSLNEKVDKEDGKQLSSNDFTDILKSKLDSLSNYDDSELRGKLDTLVTDFNTLLKANPTKAIENFNEIIAFLNEIEDDTTLKGIIAGIETQIGNINIAFNSYYTKEETDSKITESIDSIDLTPYETITGAEDKYQPKGDYLTKHQDISHLATKEEVKEAVEGVDVTDQLVNYATKDEVTNGLNKKVDKVNGKTLTSNDFTDSDKSKLDGIESGAEVNKVNSVNGRTGDVTGLAEASSIPTKVSQLTNDSNYQTESQVTKLLEGKVDKVTGKQLSTNDYTTAEKNKLAGLSNYDDTDVKKSISDVETEVEKKANKDYVDTELNKKVDKVTGKGLSTNDYTNTDKTKLDALPTAAQYNSAINSLYDNKVDKVTGKQLSTEDFTTELKNRLLSLSNYNDDALNEKIDQLKEVLDVIVNSNDTTAVIDTWKEVENFLTGITNKETLTGLLQDLKSEIVALCASTYFPISGGTVSGQTGIPLIVDTTEKTVCCSQFSIDKVHKSYVGYHNYYGAVLYNYTCSKCIGIKDDGTPHYQNNELLHKGNYSSTIFKGTSSQFLKADGSIDSTAYLPKSGGIIETNDSTSDITVPLKLNNNSSTDSLCVEQFQLAGVSKAYVGYSTTYGSIIYNYVCQKTLGIKDNGTPHFDNNTIWHEGNDGSGSGLDADLLDGKDSEYYFSNYNIPNTEILDLNTYNSNGIIRIKTTEQTTENCPITSYGVMLNFWSQSKISAAQFVTNKTNDALFFRAKDDGYKSISAPWRQIAFTNSNVASADKLTLIKLENNEDLNNIKPSTFTIYQSLPGNSILNKPDNLGGFSMLAYPSISGWVIQEIHTVTSYIFKRGFNGRSWTPWKRILTEDDIAPIITRLEALEARPNIVKVSSLPSNPDSNTLYCIPE